MRIVFVECDGCGTSGGRDHNWSTLAKRIYALGWVKGRNPNEHYCEQCKRQFVEPYEQGRKK